MADAGEERDRINRVYGEYGSAGRQARWADTQPGNRAMLVERDRVLHELLLATASKGSRPARTVLDVGCGSGDALATFLEGAATASDPPTRAVGVDLLGTRLADARDAHGARAAVADASALPFADRTFDLVLCFTVLSSVADTGVQQAIAADITRALAPGGALAWYDMRRPSPGNREVRPITEARLRELFPTLHGPVRSVTLLPPLARRLGPATAAGYPVLARVPFLRTHLAAVLRKP